MSSTRGIDFATLTLKDALDLAVLVEEEACERYGEFADQMEMHDTPDAARFFRYMIENEEKHRIALAERAWELASLRVLGFTRGEVSAFLLGELALEILLAIPLGLVSGYWLAAGIVQLIKTDEFFFPLVIQPPTYAYAAITVVAAGVASALIVRRRIDTLDLVGVLKTRE